MKPLTLDGKRFGRTTVINRVCNDKHGHSRQLCQCDCGQKHSTTTNNLMRGRTKSCGCYGLEVKSDNLKKIHAKRREETRKLDLQTTRIIK